jgi:sugar/nucleoside kinase (ribokinase family)
MSWTERPGQGPIETEGLRVTVVGNPGMDTLVMLAEESPDLTADGHFVRTVDTPGHAAAYTARMCARLGHRTRLLGSVGDDALGEHLREVLGADGVDCSLLFTDPAGTGRSVNLVTPSGRRIFFYDGGSHMTLTPPQDLVDRALAGADLVFASLPNWARTVVARARVAGIPVAVDLQDVRDSADPYRADFVASADYLFASAAHVPDPVAAATAWFAAGPARLVAFGMGPRGALLVQRRADGPPEVLHQPPPPLGLPVIDTTGAGDALATGFLDGLLFLGQAPAAALHRGQALARIVASGLGGSALVDRSALDAIVLATGLP